MWPFTRKYNGIPRMENPPPPPAPLLNVGDRVVVNYATTTVFGKVVGHYYGTSPLAAGGIWYVVEDGKGELHNAWGKLVNKF